MENEKPDDDSEEKDHGLWKGGLWKLYISRALTAWGDRLWAFGLGLLLFRIYPENLTLVAAFGPCWMNGGDVCRLLFWASTTCSQASAG